MSNEMTLSHAISTMTHRASTSPSSHCKAACEHAEHLVKKVWEEAVDAEKVMRKVFTDAWNVSNNTINLMLHSNSVRNYENHTNSG